MVVASAAALCRRVSTPSSGCVTPRWCCSPDVDDRLPTTRRSSGRRRLHPRRIRRSSTANSASAAASWTSSRRARRSRSALEFIGDTIEIAAPLRRRRRSGRSRRSTRSCIVPLRDVLPEGGGAPQGADDVGVEAVDRAGTILDYAVAAGARLFVVEHADVVAHGEAIDASLASSHAEATRRGRRVLPPEAIAVPWSELANALATATRLESLAVDEADRPVRAIACQRVTRHHGRVDRLGRRAAQVARSRRDDAVRRRIRRPRRAHDRAAARIRRFWRCRSTRAEDARAAAVLVTTGAIYRAASASPDAALHAGRRDRRLRREEPARRTSAGGSAAPRRSSPTSAT